MIKNTEKTDKKKFVQRVFSDVSLKYDLMNDIMSFGLHRTWKREVVSLLKINQKSIILDLAASIGLVEKSGAWYSYNGDRIGQGRENAKNFLKDNSEIAMKIEQEIRSHGKENKSNEENKKIDVVEEEIAVD